MTATKQEATNWAQDDLLPFLKTASKSLGAPVDRLVMATIVRRAAVKGISLGELVAEVEHHYGHQLNHIKQRKENEHGATKRGGEFH